MTQSTNVTSIQTKIDDDMIVKSLRYRIFFQTIRKQAAGPMYYGMYKPGF